MTGLSRILASVALLAGEAAPSAAGGRMAMIIRHPVAWGVVLAALGMWLLLPRGQSRTRWLGAVLGVAALACFASQLWLLGDWTGDVVFWILSGVTVVAAACTVTFRSPVYCAVWFAMALVGTAGIFMVQGAQFLSVATIVVYAGAILVTFLFVLMLAQPRGDAYYDRVSWEAILAAAVGAVLVGVLTIAVGKLELGQVQPPEAAALSADVLTPDHVARLGAELFGRHLIAVEVAGTLLLVALIGATAIVSAQRRGMSLVPTGGRIAPASAIERNGHPTSASEEEARR
jgi:NADH-quinone oxidoreductase subunit J